MSSPSNESTGTEATNENQCRIPPKSREKYMQAYNNFIEWKKSKKADSFEESVFLDYFKELAEDRQPSTLWSTYSMLKPTISLKENIDMKTFAKLSAYLKKMGKGHKSKKSNVLTSEEVETFLKEAPDEDYLITKVALIFGIEGACRGNELVKVTVDDIKQKTGERMFVKMIDSKTNEDKSFPIRDEYARIVEKYLELRPEKMKTKRFFIRYQNGICMRQVIGKNRFSVMAQEIASYLKLSDVLFYTGHCFRRTSAILLPNSVLEPMVPKQTEEQKSTPKDTTEEKVNNPMEKNQEMISCDENNELEVPASPPTTSSKALSPVPSTSKEESPALHQNVKPSKKSKSKNKRKKNKRKNKIKKSVIKKMIKIRFKHNANISL